MLIFIVGMPASGKSTFGKAFAKKINYQFIDLDELIVQNEERSVEEIFNTEGEEYFRRSECKLLKSIPLSKDAVVSTGGGTPCFFDNMDYMNRNGLSIFLHVDLETLTSRIYNDPFQQRPLFKNKNRKELFNTLQNLFEKRKPWYFKADLIRSTDFSKLF